jgi:hypothetical protein
MGNVLASDAGDFVLERSTYCSLIGIKPDINETEALPALDSMVSARRPVIGRATCVPGQDERSGMVRMLPSVSILMCYDFSPSRC